MSPQYRGFVLQQKSQKIYDRKVDIFALGLIYFELLWEIPTVHERQAVSQSQSKIVLSVSLSVVNNLSCLIFCYQTFFFFTRYLKMI